MFHPLNNLNKYKIILASGSPRRRELLGMLDIDFTVDTSHSVDEVVPENIPSSEVPAFLSRMKNEAYPLEGNDNRLVITADTIVLLDNMVFGKPADSNEAKAMLSSLSNREHEVITGVTIRTIDKTETFSACSSVMFGPLTESEISYYVDRYNPIDKAGAYGIQEWIGATAIKGISGSFYNVMGLPIQKLYNRLKDF